jgi:hypothetical protein
MIGAERCELNGLNSFHVACGRYKILEAYPNRSQTSSSLTQHIHNAQGNILLKVYIKYQRSALIIYHAVRINRMVVLNQLQTPHVSAATLVAHSP